MQEVYDGMEDLKVALAISLSLSLSPFHFFPPHFIKKTSLIVPFLVNFTSYVGFLVNRDYLVYSGVITLDLNVSAYILFEFCGKLILDDGKSINLCEAICV